MTTKRIFKMSATLLMTMAAGGLLAACGTQQAARVASVTEKDDSEIATANLVLNEGEVQQARIAMERAQNPEVRQYAQQMVQHHSQAVDRTRRLMEQRNMPKDMTASAAALEERVEMQNNRLRDMAGPEFDRQFIDYQIELHETGLTAIEEDYLQDAQDPEVRAMLNEERNLMRGHLEEARNLRNRLDQGA